MMEYCDCGTLEDAVSDGRLADSGGADVDLEFLCLTLLEIARAMEFLHKMHITHRDLKLANVLLKSSEVRILDALVHPVSDKVMHEGSTEAPWRK